jgi:Ca2+-transporting ATPase
VRRLAAVETLGSTTVICTDKTGTLTRNEMTVTAVFLGGGRDEVEATGAGFAPDGRLLEGGREVRAADDPALSALLEAAILCNDAALAPPEAPGDGGLRVVGDPMEAALLVVARKGGLEPDAVRARLPRRAEVPFDAAIKAMATGHEVPGKPFVVVKGAPEVVLDLCADAAAREDARAAVDRMAGRALRVLAFAVAEGVTLGAAGIEAVRGRAVFRGLVGLVDPPRPEARDAVLECRAAFVRTVMVTGDHRATGLAIARQIEIAREGDEAVDGRELEEMTDAALGQRLEKIAVFARVHPAQKLRIVEAFQAKDHVVAMTGDGVNDAPALARADVGVAMGRTGTEVAKEAAKIVLTDDNFATIVGAVEEGRVVYANLKKVILFLFATSLDEVLVLLSALVLGYPLPLAAVQILWINIVTEGTITVNLIMDPREGDEMRRPPISRGEPLVTRDMLGRMALMTLASATSTLLFFAWHLEQGVPFAQTQTAVFTLTAVCQWFNVLNCRSARQSALRLDILRNKWLVGGLLLGNLLHVAVVFSPPLNRLFHTAPLPWTEIFAIGAAGSVVLWVEETRKWLVRRRARVDAPSLHG